MSAGPSRMSNGTVTALRLVAGAAGLLLVLAGIFGDSLGTSAGAGFGSGQALMCALGTVLSAGALLGRSFPTVWRMLALLLLNLAVLLCALELGALGLEHLGRGWYGRHDGGPIRTDSGPGRTDSGPGRTDRGPGRTDPDPGRTPPPLQLPALYQPYVGWRSVEGSGNGMTVDSAGIRLTPGASDEPGAYTVFVLGGSTIWGFGLDDSSTIPSRLQRMLGGLTDRPVRVVNLGQVSWVSTQCLFETVLRLQAGDRPDLVLIYGGFNDVNAARSYGRAGVPFGVEKIRMLIESNASGRPETFSVDGLIRSSAFLRLVEGRGASAGQARGFLPEDATSAGSGMPPQDLAGTVIGVWSFNCSMLSSLGEEYGFGTAAFWEPALAATGKALSTAEAGLLEAEDHGMRDLLETTWQRAAALDGTFFLGGSLDGFRGEAFTDEVHLTAAATEAVAGAMLDSLVRAGLLEGLMTEEPLLR